MRLLHLQCGKAQLQTPIQARESWSSSDFFWYGPVAHLGIPNLFAVETVDSIKKADALNKARASLASNSTSTIQALHIYLQINTSDEPNKAGLRVDEASLPNSELFKLAEFVKQDCAKLKLEGLMTIGSIEQSTTNDEHNEDFEKLVRIRDALNTHLDISLGLSMGMSSDFSLAICMGSDNVRVGSKIFGERPPFKSASWMLRRTCHSFFLHVTRDM